MTVNERIASIVAKPPAQSPRILILDNLWAVWQRVEKFTADETGHVAEIEEVLKGLYESVRVQPGALYLSMDSRRQLDQAVVRGVNFGPGKIYMYTTTNTAEPPVFLGATPEAAATGGFMISSYRSKVAIDFNPVPVLSHPEMPNGVILYDNLAPIDSLRGEVARRYGYQYYANQLPPVYQERERDTARDVGRSNYPVYFQPPQFDEAVPDLLMEAFQKMQAAEQSSVERRRWRSYQTEPPVPEKKPAKEPEILLDNYGRRKFRTED